MKNLKRSVENQLDRWAKALNRKPLLLIGARQVGKTYSILEFANSRFDNNYIYINLMVNNELKSKLSNTNDPKTIISILELHFNKTINENTLIIIDEIQELKNIRTSLKFFNEQLPNYKVVGLGSYLSNTLFNDNEGFPVGKVDTIYVYPLTFDEYLRNDNELLFNKVEQDGFNELINNQLLESWKEFCVIGGMPEVVKNYLENKNLLEVNKIKNNLYNNFISDITKQILQRSDKNKAIFLFENIITFFAKENKKYSLSILDKNARYRDYEVALEYLIRTHLVHEAKQVDKLSFPLLNNVVLSRFKLFYFDIGFISYLINIDVNDLFGNDNEQINIYRGALGECFVINEYKTKLLRNNEIYYYKFIKNGISNEIDLVFVDNKNKIIPVEIKISQKSKAKSLFTLLKSNELNIEYVLYFSLNSEIKILNYNNYKILYLPIYMISFLEFENDKLDVDKLIKKFNL